MAPVPLGHKGKHLVVWRPAMEVARRLGHHELDIAALRVRQKDLRPVAAGSRRGEGKFLPIRRDGLIVIAVKVGGDGQLFGLHSSVFCERESIYMSAGVGEQIRSVRRPIGCLPDRIRGVHQVRGAIVQIVDEQSAAQMLGGFLRRRVRWRRGSLRMQCGREKTKSNASQPKEWPMYRENLHVVLLSAAISSPPLCFKGAIPLLNLTSRVLEDNV